MQEIELHMKCCRPFLYDYLAFFLHKKLEGVCGTVSGFVEKRISAPEHHHY